MNGKGKTGIVAAIATVLLIAAVGSASAVTVINSLPFEANIDGEYYVLGRDLTCDADMGGITISASNVTIDGYNATDNKYYKITGNRSTSNCDISFCPAAGNTSESLPANHSGILNCGNPGQRNVTIKNLEIEEFCTGIGLKKAHENKVLNCTIHDNGDPLAVTHGIHMIQSNKCNITGNRVYNNDGTGIGGGCSGGGNGIFLYGGNWNKITHNDITDNNKSGIFLKYYPEHNNISYNNLSGHEEGGIVLMCMMCNFNTLEHNNASGNVAGGIGIGGHNNTVNNNTANNNDGHGIWLHRPEADNNTLCNNRACENGQHGIYIVQGATGNTLYNNTVCYNGGVDIYDADGTNTGDDNTCDTTFSYNDDALTTGCRYKCPGTGPDLVISELNVSWVNPQQTQYNIAFTVKNVGRNATVNASNTSVKIVNRTGVVVHNQIYFCPPLGNVSAPNNSNTTTIGPFNVTTVLAPHIITICADINNTVNEYGKGDEENNCSSDVFGAPDLKVTHFWYVWVDESWKRYNLTYKVKNVGDRNITTPFWMNFTELHGEWSNCIDPEPITSLNVSEEISRTVGPFVMKGDSDWLQVYVDFNDTITENKEECNVSVMPQDNCYWMMPKYNATGPCRDINGDVAKCGDANLDGRVSVLDVTTVWRHVNPPKNPIDCNWTADANGDGRVTTGDVTTVWRHVNPPKNPLSCCKGCELW